MTRPANEPSDDRAADGDSAARIGTAGTPTPGDQPTCGGTPGHQATGDQAADIATTGDEATGHGTAGTATTGHQTAGDQAVGAGTTRDDAAGDHAADTATGGDGTAGAGTAGDQTTDTATAGDEATGDGTAGTSTTRDRTAGDEAAGAGTTCDGTTEDQAADTATASDEPTGDGTIGTAITRDATAGSATSGGEAAGRCCDALVVVDVQTAFVSGGGAVPGAERLLERVRELLDRARAAGAVVVHLQNDGPPGADDEPGTPGWELYLPVRPGPREYVIRKPRDDGFDATPLGEVLVSAGVQSLAICGVMSEMCVSATARTALARGYQVVLPFDAHGTYDVPAVPGIAEEVPAHVVSRVAAWSLGDQPDITSPTSAITFTP